MIYPNKLLASADTQDQTLEVESGSLDKWGGASSCVRCKF